MKKLVIAAAIVCAAAFAQAASYTWGFQNSETVAPDGQYFGEGSYANASAFLYLGTVTLVDGQFNFGTAQYLASVQGMAPDPDFNWGDFTPPGSSSSELVNQAGGQDYTLILVSDGGITDLTQYTTGNAIVKTGTSIGKAIPGVTPVYYAEMIDNTAFTAGDWQKVESVPEPTSALLMLLGVAGLALRRKQK